MAEILEKTVVADNDNITKLTINSEQQSLDQLSQLSVRCANQPLHLYNQTWKDAPTPGKSPEQRAANRNELRPSPVDGINSGLYCTLARFSVGEENDQLGLSVDEVINTEISSDEEDCLSTASQNSPRKKRKLIAKGIKKMIATGTDKIKSVSSRLRNPYLGKKKCGAPGGAAWTLGTEHPLSTKIHFGDAAMVHQSANTMDTWPVHSQTPIQREQFTSSRVCPLCPPSDFDIKLTSQVEPETVK